MLFSSPLYGVLALAAALFCRMLGVFLVLPVAALLVTDFPGSSPFAAGLVLGGYGITQALMQIPTGILADRWGKKTVLLIALALFAGGSFIAAAGESVYEIIIGRLLQGSGAVAAVSAAWISDIAPAERRAPAMAAFGAVIALAFVVSLFAAPILAAAYQLNGIFAITGWLGVISFIFVLSLPAPAITRPTANVAATLRTLLANRPLLKIGGGAFILHYALATLFFILPTNLTLALADHWQVYLASFVAALPPAVWLIMRVEKQPHLCLSLAIGSLFIGFVVLLWSTQTIIAVIALFFFFSGFTALEAALPAMAAKAAAAPDRAAAMGVVMTCEFSGVFCGGILAGTLAVFLDGQATIVIICLLLVVWLFTVKEK